MTVDILISPRELSKTGWYAISVSRLRLCTAIQLQLTDHDSSSIHRLLFAQFPCESEVIPSLSNMHEIGRLKLLSHDIWL